MRLDLQIGKILLLINQYKQIHKRNFVVYNNYFSNLEQIISDRSMLDLEIKSQMNLLEEEREKEREIISRIIKQNKN